MLEEALKWVGPYPLVQLVGSCLLLYLGVKSALAGKAAAAKADPPPLPSPQAELPDWFIHEHKENSRAIQRIMYILEDMRNQAE